jgi:N-acetylneuraminic acid mutarotase
MLRTWTTMSALVAGLTAACIPTERQHDLRWTVRFACDAPKLSTEQIRIEVRSGSCAEAGEVVYTARATRSEVMEDDAGAALASGGYAFDAVASDALGQVTATGCTDATLPTDAPVELFLASDSDGPCGKGADAGPRGRDDAGAEDAGAQLDLRDAGVTGEDGGPSQDGGSAIESSVMPYAAGCLTAAVLSDGVHVLGGATDFDGSSTLRDHHVVDPVSGAWASTAKEVPDANTWCARAYVHQDKLYLVGGWPSGNTLFRRFDPATNEWESLASVPGGYRYGFASAVVSGFLYLIGGRDQAETSGAGYKYEFATGTWSPIAGIPENQGSGSLAAAAWGKRIYVINGDAAGGDTLLQIYNTSTNVWTSGPRLSAHSEGAAAVADQGKVYFFGGIESAYDAQGAVRNTVRIFDTSSGLWSDGPAISTARFRFDAVHANGAFLLFGGFLSTLEGTSSFEVYRP